MRLLAVSIWSVFDEGIKRNDTIGHFTSDTLVWTIDKSSCESRQNCASLSLQFNIISQPCLLDKRVSRTRKRKKVYIKYLNFIYTFFYHQRKRGDSNPRYSYPYASLANLWFQPLTHTSFR